MKMNTVQSILKVFYLSHGDTEDTERTKNMNNRVTYKKGLLCASVPLWQEGF